MSAKRDILVEIERRRSRLLNRVPRLVQARRRLHDLMGAEAFLSSRHKTPVLPRITKELHRYFPIALVAVSEGYFRMLYRDLIDSGEPYRSNARHFKDVRCDLDTLLATHSGSATVGEIISHQLPHNNPSQIESNLSVILAEDFSKTFRARLEKEDRESSGGTLFQKQLPALFHQAFTLRHTFCHELATRATVSVRMSATMTKVFMMWIHLVDEHIQEHQKTHAT